MDIFDHAHPKIIELTFSFSGRSYFDHAHPKKNW